MAPFLRIGRYNRNKIPHLVICQPYENIDVISVVIPVADSK
jgi:hypothetical protein